MREAVEVLALQPDALEQLQRCACARPSLDDALQLERRADDLRRRACAGSATRTGPGRPSASRARIGRSSRCDEAVMSRPSKRIVPPVGFEQPHERARQRRLAAARLADEPERLARAQRERHVVDRVDVADRAVDEQALRIGKYWRTCSTSSSGPSPFVVVSASARARSSCDHALRLEADLPVGDLALGALLLERQPAAVGVAAARRDRAPRAPASARTAPNSCRQRGRKWQPSGRLCSDGGRPGIDGRRSGRGRSTRAIEPSRPHV